MRTKRFSIVIVPAMVVAVACFVVAASVPAGAKAKKPPDACLLITKADVSTTFAKLEAALQPVTVGEPTIGKPASQGGQGTYSCSTSFQLPNSVGGSVLVKTFPLNSKFPCIPKGQPGKTVKVSGMKAFVEPVPSHANVTRDITFVDKGGCAFIEIFLSGGSARVPQSAFVDLAAAALAK